MCAYTGGFSVSATAGGATRAIAVDASAGALDLAGKNAELNGVGDEVERVRGDAFGWLGEQRDAGRAFDMIVLDPPRFARSRKGLRSALQGYERLNRLAIECMVEGGVLVTFSCSGRVTAEEFQDAVARAATPTGRTVRILERLTGRRLA